MPRGWIGAVSIGLGRALSAITPRRRRLGLVVEGTALAAWSPAPALAAAPGNDNYLASINIRGPHGRAARQYEPAPFPTGEATVQVDLFNPDREGLPFGGGPPEDQACEGTSYGKTVWYDVHPDQPGVFSIETSGYDAVIRLYEFDPATARITRTVGCFNTSAGPAESASFGEVERGDHYTIQVGGVVVGGAAASGVLDFNFRYFADHDGDGVVKSSTTVPRWPAPAAAARRSSTRHRASWLARPRAAYASSSSRCRACRPVAGSRSAAGAVTSGDCGRGRPVGAARSGCDGSPAARFQRARASRSSSPDPQAGPGPIASEPWATTRATRFGAAPSRVGWTAAFRPGR